MNRKERRAVQKKTTEISIGTGDDFVETQGISNKKPCSLSKSHYTRDSVML